MVPFISQLPQTHLAVDLSVSILHELKKLHSVKAGMKKPLCGILTHILLFPKARVNTSQHMCWISSNIFMKWGCGSAMFAGRFSENTIKQHCGKCSMVKIPYIWSLLCQAVLQRGAVWVLKTILNFPKLCLSVGVLTEKSIFLNKKSYLLSVLNLPALQPSRLTPRPALCPAPPQKWNCTLWRRPVWDNCRLNNVTEYSRRWKDLRHQDAQCSLEGLQENWRRNPRCTVGAIYSWSKYRREIFMMVWVMQRSSLECSSYN